MLKKLLLFLFYFGCFSITEATNFQLMTLPIMQPQQLREPGDVFHILSGIMDALMHRGRHNLEIISSSAIIISRKDAANCLRLLTNICENFVFEEFSLNKGFGQFKFFLKAAAVDMTTLKEIMTTFADLFCRENPSTNRIRQNLLQHATMLQAIAKYFEECLVIQWPEIYHLPGNLETLEGFKKTFTNPKRSSWHLASIIHQCISKIVERARDDVIAIGQQFFLEESGIEELDDIVENMQLLCPLASNTPAASLQIQAPAPSPKQQAPHSKKKTLWKWLTEKRHYTKI